MTGFIVFQTPSSDVWRLHHLRPPDEAGRGKRACVHTDILASLICDQTVTQHPDTWLGVPETRGRATRDSAWWRTSLMAASWWAMSGPQEFQGSDRQMKTLCCSCQLAMTCVSGLQISKNLWPGTMMTQSIGSYCSHRAWLVHTGHVGHY